MRDVRHRSRSPYTRSGLLGARQIARRTRRWHGPPSSRKPSRAVDPGGARIRPAVLPAPAPPRVVALNLDPLTFGIDARPFGRGPLFFLRLREAGHRCATFERTFFASALRTAFSDRSSGSIAPVSPFFATFCCGLTRRSPPERPQVACSPGPPPLAIAVALVRRACSPPTRFGFRRAPRDRGRSRPPGRRRMPWERSINSPRSSQRAPATCLRLNVSPGCAANPALIVCSRRLLCWGSNRHRAHRRARAT